MMLYPLLLLLSLGASLGQELTDMYCRTMVPSEFFADPQTIPAPFDITVDTEQYFAGVSMKVTINATSNYRFRGFLIEARRADPTKDQTQQIGYFSQIQGTKTGCPGTFGNALSHSFDEDGWDKEKRSLVLTWTSGDPAQGHIVFKVTIIVSDELYWVAEKSKIIYDTDAPSMPPVSTKDPSQLFSIIDVSQCGKTKGCYRNPAGCTQETCDMLVTWRDRGEFVDFELTGDSDGWVAVGFSEDKKMGKDDVTECVWNEATSLVEIRQSFNEEDDKRNVVLDPPDLGLYNRQGYMSEGRLRCSFSRSKVIIGRSSKFDLTAKYHILMTRGEMDTQGNKEIHVLEPNKYPYVTPSKVSVTRHVDLTSTARYPLVKAHGILMILAWMLCGCTGLILAKYYKPMWPNDRVCGEKVWFAFHRVLMLCVLGLTILAFILIFIHVGGYSWMPFYSDKAHPPLGICVTILVLLNPLISMCRCTPKSEYRPIFNWFHWLFGTVASVLAMPTLFIGLNLPKAHVPWWATWVMVVFMLFHLIIELLLEIHGCINARKQKLRDEEYEIRKKNDPRGKEPEPVGRRFKKRVLTVYLIVAIILTIIMVIAIAVG